MIKWFKSAAILFFKLRVNEHVLGLSTELLFIMIAQGGAKLSAVKVGSKKMHAVTNSNLFNKT